MNKMVNTYYRRQWRKRYKSEKKEHKVKKSLRMNLYTRIVELHL